VISFPYTKNVIMSPAGVFLAPAVFAAARAWLNGPGLAASGDGRASHRDERGARLAARPSALTAVLLLALACGWAFRSAGVHYNLRRTAASERTEWIEVDAWLERQRIVVDGPQALSLRDALRRDAIWNHPTPFQPTARWTRWFDIDY
jgi:hypothetical protein